MQEKDDDNLRRTEYGVDDRQYQNLMLENFKLRSLRQVGLATCGGQCRQERVRALDLLHKKVLRTPSPCCLLQEEHLENPSLLRGDPWRLTLRFEWGLTFAEG